MTRSVAQTDGIDSPISVNWLMDQMDASEDVRYTPVSYNDNDEAEEIDLEESDGVVPPPLSGEEEQQLAEIEEPRYSERTENILRYYSHIDPGHKINRRLLKKALAFFDGNRSRLRNHNVIGIVDFSKPSWQRRFYLVDVHTGRVGSVVVAHGSGSDPSNSGHARRFSNTPNSRMSSLGFYLTAEKYDSPKFGYARRLDGLSSTNSNVRKRAIVLHGSRYVKSTRHKQGRSWGCLATSYEWNEAMFDVLGRGALIYAGR